MTDINALLREISQYLRLSSWGHLLSHKDCVKCGYANKLDDFLAAEMVAVPKWKEVDAECFAYLQNLPVEKSQAYFWNWKSRKQRRKAILSAMLAAAEKEKK